MTRASGTARSVAAIASRYGATIGAILLLAMAFAALAWLDYTARRDAARYEADRAISLGADDLARALDPPRRLAAQLAIASVQDAADRASLQQLLDLAPALVGGVRGAAVIDAAAGTLVGVGGPAAATVAGLADASMAALTGATADAIHLGRVRPDDAAARTDLLVLAEPRYDADGDVAGVVLVVFDAAVLDVAHRMPGSAGRGRFQLLGLDAAAPPPLSPSGAARESPIAGFPVVLRYTYPIDAVMQGWRATWWRNGLLMAAVAAAVGAAVGLSQRRRRRLLALQAARRGRETVALRRDVSELAAAARRADELNRTRSRFFAQVTHELRTPLNAVLGFSEVIRSELFGPAGNRRYVEYAGLINDAGTHLLSLIDDLLDMAKLEAGKMEIAPIRVSAAALARSALDLLDLTAQQCQIALTIDGIDACPDLYVDLRAAKQVLINLLSNALKFTPSGGRIDMRFAARPDGMVAITVADTGTGMSEEDLRVAFEPFGRGTAARRAQGTGLGLPLARALAELHGGELSLTSEPGRGTRATVVFPSEPGGSSEARLPRIRAAALAPAEAA